MSADRSCDAGLRSELQAFITEVETETADFVENKILEAIRDGDMATARWYADRQMRDRGYGRLVAHEDVAEPDPEALKAAHEMIQFYHHEMERRYRAGLGPPPLMFEAKLKK